MKYHRLTNENIADCIDSVTSELMEAKLERKEILQRAMILEEMLLKYQSRFGAEIDFGYTVVKKFKSAEVSVHVICPKCDVLVDGDGEDAEVLAALLRAQGNIPFVYYQAGENVLSFILKKKRRISMLKELLISAMIGAACGFSCLLLPDSFRSILSAQIVDPLFSTLMNVLSCIAGPLIFLSVTWGIYEIGDVTALRMIGKKMMGRFLKKSFLLELLAVASILFWFSITSGSGGRFDFSYFYQLILDIVPSNIVEPFANGNTLQIIFLGVCFGLAALLLGKKTLVVASFVEQVNFIVQLIMDFISGMISIFVFMSVFSNIINGNIAEILQVYKFFPAMILACLIPMLLSLAEVSIRFRISPLYLIKKQLSTSLIALSTASSSAAFSENLNCCTDRMGINKKLAIFGIPIGQVVYAIGTGLAFDVIGLCVSDIAGIEMTPNWLLTLFIMSFILGIATPPIPGGAMAAFTVFAIQLGIPDNMVSLCIALSIVGDFMATTTNLFCLQLELVDLSAGLSMLDTTVLKGKQKTD